MEALVGQQGNLVFNPEWDREPVEGFENWCDVVKFSCPCKDPGSTVLNVLEFLDVFVGDPGKKSITVVQPGGDKGMDEFFCIWESE